MRNGSALGVAELRRTISPRHHLWLVHDLDLIFQPRELCIDVIDQEFDDRGAVGAGFGAALP